MTIDVRVTRPDEYRAASNAIASALLFPPHDDESWERSRPSWDEAVSLSAWDGDRCVGHACQFLVDTTVPGGARVATGAVSRVGVLSTHRRRGLATSLMHGLIADAVERDLPLMSLRASEAVIYHRYGFGMAGEFRGATIDPARARPVGGAATGGEIRFLRPDEILATVPTVYERAADRRPGFVSRPPSWWRRYLLDATSGSKCSYVVVHVDQAGTLDGFAHYDVEWNSAEPGMSGGKGEIHDVFADSDSVELALWAYLLDIDLVRKWSADERPVDDVVQAALGDRRAYKVTSVEDEQWVRLVDVDRALRSRSYNAASGAVTIAVHDPLLDRNDGTWRIDADGASRTDDEPDLEVGISTLSAAYLGGTPWHTLAAVGEVTVNTPGSVATADLLFASRPLPFCGSFF